MFLIGRGPRESGVGVEARPRVRLVRGFSELTDSVFSASGASSEDKTPPAHLDRLRASCAVATGSSGVGKGSSARSSGVSKRSFRENNTRAARRATTPSTASTIFILQHSAMCLPMFSKSLLDIPALTGVPATEGS
jgi:hypothetical protein